MKLSSRFLVLSSYTKNGKGKPIKGDNWELFKFREF